MSQNKTVVSENITPFFIVCSRCTETIIYYFDTVEEMEQAIETISVNAGEEGCFSPIVFESIPYDERNHMIESHKEQSYEVQ